MSRYLLSCWVTRNYHRRRRHHHHHHYFSSNNNNNNNNNKSASYTRNTFNRLFTKDGYTWNITHTAESTTEWNLKHERWGSPLVQETYREERACDKWHNNNNNTLLLLRNIVLFCAEVKERVELYLYVPSVPSRHVMGWTVPFYLSPVLCMEVRRGAHRLLIAKLWGKETIW